MSANPWQLASFAMTPSAQFNFEGYSDPAANVIFSKLQNATSVAAIAKAAKELNAYVVDQAWFVPWYSKKVPFAHTSAVNVKPQAGNVVPFLYNMTAGK
jgi:peptide/nickel transport system substrate-binding protein